MPMELKNTVVSEFLIFWKQFHNGWFLRANTTIPLYHAAGLVQQDLHPGAGFAGFDLYVAFFSYGSHLRALEPHELTRRGRA